MMRQIDTLKLQQDNQQLRSRLDGIREQLRRLKRIPCAGLPERIASGPELTGCWTMLPLFGRTMLRGVLGPATSAAVIEVLDALYRSADLPITR
jgi:hypothetical protein